MKHILLTGAGFSHNWGGWLANEAFEYLLGSVHVDDAVRNKLWITKERGGGFEDALAEFQAAYENRPHNIEEQHLRALTNAVTAMFAEMAVGYNELEFDDRTAHNPIKQFLADFDAIYTLNQDTLLEQHYLGANWGEQRRVSEIPGIKSKRIDLEIGARRYPIFEPDMTNVEAKDGTQPYIKLHGSFNWMQDEGSMLILGGNKRANIEKYPLLKRYHELFREDLSQPNVRLMIIGYSFNDPHINEAIVTAANLGRAMKIFVIDPTGVDVLDKRKPAMGIPQPRSEAPLLEALSARVFGASRRRLRSIFADDQVEKSKVLRFFAPHERFYETPQRATITETKDGKITTYAAFAEAITLKTTQGE